MASPEKSAAAAEAVSTVRRPGRLRVVHPDVAEFLANFHRLDVAVATAQLEALGRWRHRHGGARRLLPVYTCHHGIDSHAVAMAPRRKRRRPRKTSSSSNVVDDDDAELKLENFEPTPQPLSQQMSTKIGKLMSRAAQQMSQSPAMIHRDNSNNNCNDPAMSLAMARCTRPAYYDESPTLKDDPFLSGLVLNFICPSAVLPAGELAKIFCQFGPIMEAKTENSYGVVMFKRRADAEAAFAGTAKISGLCSSLISFRLTYSMSPSSPIDLPESTLNNGNDHLDF
uniref:RRM domain-containing protein n=1 Tax=Leersia perrieri TaxID=77586 RepID=A0A0D9WC74_9ORYZ